MQIGINNTSFSPSADSYLMIYHTNINPNPSLTYKIIYTIGFYPLPTNLAMFIPHLYNNIYTTKFRWRSILSKHEFFFSRIRIPINDLPHTKKKYILPYNNIMMTTTLCRGSILSKHEFFITVSRFLLMIYHTKKYSYIYKWIL